MSKFLQIVYVIWSALVRLAGWVVSLSILVFSILILILQTKPVKSLLLERVTSGFNQTYTSQLTADGLSGFLPFSIKLEAVTLRLDSALVPPTPESAWESSSPTTPESPSVPTPESTPPPSIRARQVHVYFDLAELLRGHWEVETFRLNTPQITTSLRPDSLGFDLSLLFKKRVASEGEAGVDVAGVADSSLALDTGRRLPEWLRRSLDKASASLLIPEIAIVDGQAVIWNAGGLVEGLSVPDPFLLEEVFTELFVESNPRSQILEILSFTAKAPGTDFQNLQLSGQFYRSPERLEWNAVRVTTLGTSLEIGVSVETDSSETNLDLLSMQGYRNRPFKIDISVPRLDPEEIGSLYPPARAFTPQLRNDLIGDLSLTSEDGVLFLDRLTLFTGQSSLSMRGRWTMGEDPLEGLDVDLVSLTVHEDDVVDQGVWKGLARAFPGAVLSGRLASSPLHSAGNASAARQVALDLSLSDRILRSQLNVTFGLDASEPLSIDMRAALIMDSLEVHTPPAGEWTFTERLLRQIGVDLSRETETDASNALLGGLAGQFSEVLEDSLPPFLASGAISLEGRWNGTALRQFNILGNLYDVEAFGATVQSISALASSSQDRIQYGLSSVHGLHTLQMEGTLSVDPDSAWWAQDTRIDPIPSSWLPVSGLGQETFKRDSAGVNAPDLRIRSQLQKGFPDEGAGWIEVATSGGMLPQGTLEPLFARLDVQRSRSASAAVSDPDSISSLASDLPSDTLRFTSSAGDVSLAGQFHLRDLPRHLQLQGQNVWSELSSLLFLERTEASSSNGRDATSVTPAAAMAQARPSPLDSLDATFTLDLRRPDLIGRFLPWWPTHSYAIATGRITSGTDRFELQLQMQDSLLAGEGLRADSLTIALESSFDFSAQPADAKLSLTVGASKATFNTLTLSQVRTSNIFSGSRLVSDLSSLQAEGVDHLAWRATGEFSGQEIRIEPTVLTVGRGTDLWSLSGEPTVRVESEGRILVEQALLQNDLQEIMMDGSWGDGPEEALLVRLRQVDVAGISSLVQKMFRFEGRMDGQFIARKVNQVPVFEGELGIDSLVFNGQLAGDVFLESTVETQTGDYLAQLRLFTDPERYGARLAATGGTGHDFLLNSRFVNPLAPSADSLLYRVDAEFRQIDLMLLEVLMPNILERSRGQASGRGTIIGRRDDVDIRAGFTIAESDATPVFLNTRLFVTGDVTYSDDVGFSLNRLTLDDPFGGRGTLSGIAGMTAFEGLIPLDLTLTAQNMLLIDNPFDPDIPFYSTVFGSGTFRLTGTQLDPLVQTPVPIRVSGGSKVSVPLLDETELITDSGFITFVQDFESATPVTRDGSVVTLNGEAAEGGSINFSERFTLDLQFESTEIVTFEMIFDPLTNDMISANGSGQIGIRLVDETYSMFGQLNIESGIYNFVSGDILARRFQLQRGGTIRWDGDPVNARLDVSAIYRARPPLSTLGGAGAAATTSVGQRIPIELVLKIFGTIDQVENEFFFQLPSNFTGISDPTLATRLTSLNRNQEEKLIQAFSILLTGNFIPSRESTFEDTSVLEGLTGSAVVINPFVSSQVISPLLSNQINSLLTQDVTFDVDVNIDAYNEVELGVALRLYNDRLVLRREGQITGEQSTIGDIGATFQINRTLSLTAFHRQDPAFRTSGDGGGAVGISAGAETQTINGVGIQARTQFNSWGELRQRISNTFSSLFGRKEDSEDEDTLDESGQDDENGPDGQSGLESLGTRGVIDRDRTVGKSSTRQSP